MDPEAYSEVERQRQGLLLAVRYLLFEVFHRQTIAISFVYSKLTLDSSTPIVNTSHSNESSASTSCSSRSATPEVSMETVADLCKDTLTLMRSICTRLGVVEERTITLSSTVKELNDFVKKYYKHTFTIKGSAYEVSDKCSNLGKR